MRRARPTGWSRSARSTDRDRAAESATSWSSGSAPVSGINLGQLLGSAGKQAAVRTAFETGVDRIGGGLGEGEGQVPQIRGQRCELVCGLVPVVCCQRRSEVGDRSRLREQADSDHMAPVPRQSRFATPGGGKAVAVRACRRPQAAQIRGVGDVIAPADPAPDGRPSTSCGLGPGSNGSISDHGPSDTIQGRHALYQGVQRVQGARRLLRGAETRGHPGACQGSAGTWMF